MSMENHLKKNIRLPYCYNSFEQNKKISKNYQLKSIKTSGKNINNVPKLTKPADGKSHVIKIMKF